MLRAVKIMLLPTPEQEILFWKSAGTARWAYNFYLSEKERVYHEYKNNGMNGKKNISGCEVRKYINNVFEEDNAQMVIRSRKQCNEAGCKGRGRSISALFQRTVWQAVFQIKAQKQNQLLRELRELEAYAGRFSW